VQFFISNWYLFAVAIVSGGLLAWPLIKGGSASGSISTAEAVRLVNREKGILIDVSEPAEYAAGHANGSRNIPLASLEGAKNLPTNKALPLIVLCATGARASKATATLRKLGYENARPLAGGLKAWREANLPVEKTA
jgi:rhodanese-related sulfurtransferase